MKYPMLRWLAMGLLLAGPAVWAGTIYKCKGTEGVLLYQEKPCDKEVQSISSWASSSGAQVEDDGSGDQPLVIGQGDGGHYFVDGSVNGQFLSFVVDTGATFVALPLAVAASAGLKCKQLVMLGTANGAARGCTATIQKLKFGKFTLRYVDAVIQPNLSQPLLGMNVLRQFRVEQDNGQMRLSKKY